MRYALSVVDPVNIHLASAVSTIHKSRQRVSLAPAVGIATNIPSDTLHIIKRLLIYDRLLRILEYDPVILTDIMALFVLEVLGGLEIDRVTEILPLFQNICYR